MSERLFTVQKTLEGRGVFWIAPTIAPEYGRLLKVDPSSYALKFLEFCSERNILCALDVMADGSVKFEMTDKVL